MQKINGPSRIDDSMSEKDVAILWKNNTFSVLNEINDSKCKMEFTSQVGLTNRGVFGTVSPYEVCMPEDKKKVRIQL